MLFFCERRLLKFLEKSGGDGRSGGVVQGPSQQREQVFDSGISKGRRKDKGGSEEQRVGG